MTNNNESVLLDLDTSENRPHRLSIRIDGIEWPLKFADEYEIADFARFKRFARNIDTLDFEDEKGADEMTKRVREATRMMFLDISDEVFNKLRDVQCFQILSSFVKASSLSKPSGLTTQFPNSNDSTAEAPKDGSS